MVRLYEKLYEYDVEMLVTTYRPADKEESPYEINDWDYFDVTVYFTFMKEGHVKKCPVALDLLRLKPMICENILIDHFDKFINSLK